MWLCLNDAVLSIVKKNCKPGELLVRARRPGDIEKVFGKGVKVTRSTDSDYLFRATVKIEDVELALKREIEDIDYENVEDHALHMAYMKVWDAMSGLQNPPPYSAPFTGRRIAN